MQTWLLEQSAISVLPIKCKNFISESQMQIFWGKTLYNLYDLECDIHDWNVRDTPNLSTILKLSG